MEGAGVIVLDTHTLLWMDRDDPALGPVARGLIEEVWHAGQVAVSAISFWSTRVQDRGVGAVQHPDVMVLHAGRVVGDLRTLPAIRVSNASKWWWSLIGGLVFTAWDVSMDPAMVKTTHWLWNVPDLSGNSVISRSLGTPFFFGMPLTNWLGWLLTGILVARAMLAIVPPSVWVRDVAGERVPIWLYAVNGLLPLAICFAQDMVLAGVLGTSPWAFHWSRHCGRSRRARNRPARPQCRVWRFQVDKCQVCGHS